MKRIGIISLLVMLLVACQELPEGNYVVYPDSGQIITPQVIQYGRYAVELRYYPTIQDTPTQEVVTETPTPVPTVQPATCRIQAKEPVRVRLLPKTDQVILGVASTGQLLEATAQYYDKVQGVLWYQVNWTSVQTGWTAAAYYTQLTTCTGLPSVNPFPQAPVLAIHTVVGANVGQLTSSFGILRAKGIPFGAKVVSDVSACQSVYNAGGVCIYRSVLPSDCPNVLNSDAKLEAKLYLLSLSPYINPVLSYASWIEVVNECNYDREYWEWWNTFVLETVRLAHSWNWPPLVVPTFGPGWPVDLDMLNVLAPSLAAVRDTGGMLGLHSYSIYLDSLLCPYNQWLSYRHQMTHARLVTLGLGDLNFALTEVARGDGTLVPMDNDFVCYYQALKNDSYVRFVALWTLGKASHWGNADLEGHLNNIFQEVH